MSGLPGEQCASMIHKRHRKTRNNAKRYLINIINYIHFQDKTLIIHIVDTQNNRVNLFHIHPAPCQDDTFECRLDQLKKENGSNSFKIKSISVPKGDEYITFVPESLVINHDIMRCKIPESFTYTNKRKYMRHECQGISADIESGELIGFGELKDFASDTVKVKLHLGKNGFYDQIQLKDKVTLKLSDDTGSTFYEGTCELYEKKLECTEASYIFRFSNREIRRYSPKKYRTDRRLIDPPPDIVFRHPLTGKFVSLKIEDISGIGFSVLELEKQALLFAGLTLPDVEFRFPDGVQLKCSCQVIYSKPVVGERDRSYFVRCGLAILDMPMEDHVRLLGLLNRVQDSHTYMNNKVNMDSLWRFFFNTGFIYPKKYDYFSKNKTQIKRTLTKLYTESPEIARHFIYQKNGDILGHMAALRTYENTWMLHHHAANTSSSLKAGIAVLNMASKFFLDSTPLASSCMNYAMNYYRPDNKFPRKVFGGVERFAKDRKICSLESFAYFHMQSSHVNTIRDSRSWRLTPTTSDDLTRLKEYYEEQSGGLMIECLDLNPSALERDTLTAAYQKAGFKRERQLYSLMENGVPSALFMLSISDAGINMSDLVNCIHIFILKPESVSSDTLHGGLHLLCGRYNQDKVTCLLYPQRIADDLNIPYEKLYTLWSMDTTHSDLFFRYLKGLLRFI